jgi:O-antigen/teichoic acid export membrane protein
MFRFLLKNDILRAYGTSLLGVFSGLLTNLWLLREITQVIPVHDFGIYAFVLQITAYLSILQLGLDFAASRQIAESLGRNQADEANRALSHLLCFNYKIVLGVLAGVLTLSASLWWGVLFPRSIDAASTSPAASVALVAGIAQVITFLTRPYSAALIGSQFQDTVNFVTAARTVATTILAFVFLKAGFYVLAVPAAEVVMQFINWTLFRRLARQKCFWIAAQPAPTGESKVLGSMLRYGGLTALGGVAWTVEAGMDLILLGVFADARVAAAYVLWWRFPQMLLDLCTRLAFSAFPRFSHSFGESRAAAQLVFSKVAYFTLGLATLALLGISLWLHPFVHLWIGADYLGVQSIHLAKLMGLLVCLRVCGNLLGMFWLASGHAKFTTALAWTQAFLKLALAVLLVPRWGILGVVIASCVASLLQVAAMSWFLLRERLLTLALGMRALAFITFAGLISLLAARGTLTVGWLGLIGGASVTALLWAVMWLVLACTGELRQPIFFLLRGLSRRIPLWKAL